MRKTICAGENEAFLLNWEPAIMDGIKGRGRKGGVNASAAKI